MECKFSKIRNKDERIVRLWWTRDTKDAFKYIGSIIHKNGEIEDVVNHIKKQGGWHV